MLSINPSGLWQKTFLADMLVKLDTSFGAMMSKAHSYSTEWAQDAPPAIVHLFIELRRAKKCKDIREGTSMATTFAWHAEHV